MEPQTMGTPRKVLAKAAEFGAHADCIAAERSGGIPCALCQLHVSSAIEFHYGHLETTSDVIFAITTDMLEGQ